MNARALSRYLFIFLLIFALREAQAAPSEDDAQILHLLNRITFGPAPGDIEAVRQMSMNAYIERQLHPEEIAVPDALQRRLEQLPTLNASMAALAQAYQKPNEDALSADQKMELNQQRNEIVQELMEAKILRAIMSPAQLQEVMTDFWFNHFNVFAEKGLDMIFISSYERDAIRPYALGRFRDLVQATSHHPAMLFYLDNWQNTDPNSLLARKAAQRRGKELGINENYARELMELHTLGVDGGYTQQDVTTLAHILTGWGLGRGPNPADKAFFMFDPKRHDYNNVIFLGQTVRGGGSEEIENVLDFLAQHPSTAHHIAYELAQYFVADDPPQSLVNKLTDSFEESGGDIAEVLRTLFHSSEFFDPQYEQAKFKPPLRFVVSAMRASYVVPGGDTRLLQAAIGSMGEPLYRCQTPNGYSNTKDEWLNSDSLLKRITVARALGRLLDANAAATITQSLGDTWSANTLSAVNAAKPELKPVLLLSSPEFLYY